MPAAEDGRKDSAPKMPAAEDGRKDSATKLPAAEDGREDSAKTPTAEDGRGTRCSDTRGCGPKQARRTHRPNPDGGASTERDDSGMVNQPNQDRFRPGW
jgi:hypothetical protein